MAGQPEFKDPEYDRKLAEYKALKAKVRQQQMQETPSQNAKRY
jgi:NAD-dependent DNA ligase